MDLTIVIVNYRVKYFLEQTLASVEEALRGIDGEVVVVDNNSGDDSIAYCRERFPRVTFVENNENVGFARANNQAIATARGEFTLILNPDTIVTHASLAQCMEWMKSHADCAAIGVHMMDGNGEFLPESKRGFPTPWVSFCKIFGLSSLFPRSRVFARYHMRYLAEREAHSVDILSGAFMFCRTALLQTAGGFDEDFFMYGEDIDLSYRLAQKGHHNYYLPVDIIHYKGESTKKESLRYVQVFYDAMLIFYRKHFPRQRWLMYPFIKAGVALRKWMAIANRAVRRLFRRGGVGESDVMTGAPWVIMAHDAQQVADAAGIRAYLREIPAEAEARVLLDGGSLSYAEIVDMISRYHRKGLEFHIYSAKNKMIISPKMSQQ